MLIFGEMFAVRKPQHESRPQKVLIIRGIPRNIGIRTRTVNAAVETTNADPITDATERRSRLRHRNLPDKLAGFKRKSASRFLNRGPREVMLWPFSPQTKLSRGGLT